MPQFDASPTSVAIVFVGLAIVIPLIAYGYYLDAKDRKRRNGGL